MVGEHGPGPAVGLVDQAADLPVDGRGHLLGVVGLVAEVAPEEHLPARLAELLRAQGVAHAVLGDHGPGDVGHLLDVVFGAGGRLGEHQLLGRAAPEAHGHGVAQLAAGVVVAVLGEREGQPRDRLRATIDTLWIGSAWCRTWPTRAWPASW